MWAGAGGDQDVRVHTYIEETIHVSSHYLLRL